MYSIIKPVILLFIVGSLTSAQTTLSGSIGGMHLEKSGNPYIISENLTIASGEKLTIDEGCVFLFNLFTGIDVEGSIEVNGTSENPVIFTSINNKKYNPSASQPVDQFDWNGIRLQQRARIAYFSHIILEFSVYGIKSQIDQLVLLQGIFRKNGQFHFTINEVIQPVESDQPFSFGQTEPKATADSVKVRKKKSWIRPVALCTGFMGIASLGTSGYFFSRKFSYREKYTNADHSQTDRDHYYNRQIDMLRYAQLSGIAGGLLSVSGGTLLIIDNIGRKKMAIACNLVIGGNKGILFTVRFYNSP